MNESTRTIVACALARLCLGLVALVCAGASAPNWEHGEGFRRTKLPVRDGAKQEGFALIPGSQSGILFTNTLSEQRALTSQILPNGSGVAAGDIDGDGLPDLFFCGLKCGNKLYRNLGGWKFEDITTKAGVARPDLDCTGSVFADLDGDGDLDLVLNSIGGGTHLCLNAGTGVFAPQQQVLNPNRGGTSLAVADLDGDGLLDLYVANYRTATLMDAPNTRFNIRMVDGKPAVASINGKPLTDPEWTNRFEFRFTSNQRGGGKFGYDELGEPDALYRNKGGGRFEEVPFAGNFIDEDGRPLSKPPFDWGLSVMLRDLNGDGRPDIYVCNDFKTPDRIWLNDGGMRFKALPRLAIRQTTLSSMCLDVADINRDGLDDIFVGDMLSREHARRMVQRTDLRPDSWPPGAIDNRPQASRNMLYLNQGDGSYAEIAQLAGVEASEWSWTPLFIDVDLDGYEDLLVSNGFERDNMNIDAVETYEKARSSQKSGAMDVLQLRRGFPKLATPNCAFRNTGNLRFEECAEQWGFATPVISQGACLADLDNDGAQEVIVNNLNSEAGVYRNLATAPRVSVRLKGLPPNTRGIGARITLFGGAVARQDQEIIAGGRYLSSDDPMRVFAAGSVTNDMRLEVVWRSGKRSIIRNVNANYLYEVNEASAGQNSSSPRARLEPLFRDNSALLNHTHHEEAFDDFGRQPSIPKRLSQLGPGVCWADLNGDGFDDLIITCGKGGTPAAFISDGKGGFLKRAAGPGGALRDSGAAVCIPDRNGKPTALFGSMNYEDGLLTTPVEMWSVSGTPALPSIPPGTASTGPLAIADIDGDGDLDLFIGARVNPARFPEPPSSRLLRATPNGWTENPADSKALEHVGMVSGAVWSDLTGDGSPELVLACEWGPLKIFHLVGDVLKPTSDFAVLSAANGFSLGPLSTLTGFWNGVTTCDIDGDGWMDIVASNWGLNTRYEAQTNAPLRIYHGDFNGDGSCVSISAWRQDPNGPWLPTHRLDQVARAMPFLMGLFPTHEAWSRAEIPSILGDRTPKARHLEARWLESTVLLNRRDHFEARPLPLEAQLTPAFAVVANDLNGDGAEDIFLSQNFFAVDVETSRSDAGRGLLLLGDGTARLKAVTTEASGLAVYGEQRGAAAADYDADGRVDLVVAQNAAATKLFRNLKAKPGLRVRLKGPPGNPHGYGVQLRLASKDQLGPVRELHGGSGYWSQDSAFQVMCAPFEATEIRVRWPGKAPVTTQIPKGATQLEVPYSP